jgi:hypothetical protein
VVFAAHLYATEPNKKIKLFLKTESEREKMLQQVSVSEFQSWKSTYYTKHRTGQYSVILLPQMIYIQLYQN